MIFKNAFNIDEMLEAARSKEFKRGFKEGARSMALEIAENCLNILDDETISLATGVDIETVKKLRKNNS